MKRTCVVLRAHFVNDELYRNAYLPLRASLPESYHLLVAHDESVNPWDREVYPVNDYICLTEDMMRKRNPYHKQNWYNIDSFLDFVGNSRPDFDYYWVLEYDVRFSGEWCHFFSAQDQARSEDALLVNGTWPFNGDKSWWVWHELQWPEEKPIENRYAGFVFLGRYSKRLIRTVHQSMGVRSGFSEVYLATLCHEEGLSTASIGDELLGSTCSTSEEIDETVYLERRSLEPGRIFHKVR